MKTLIIIRHGSYIKNSGNLSETGVLQIANLIEPIKEKIVPTRTDIISSTASQAVESAKLLCQSINLTAELNSVFSTANGCGLNVLKATEKLLDIGKNKSIDTLILVTHLEYCSELAVSVPYKILGRRIFLKKFYFRTVK